jgi:lipopolysaccharide transport system ATP-binding protein
MSEPIIQVQNLSKQYRIGAREAAYSTFRESLTGAMKAPFKRLGRNGSSPDDTSWALKDVNFKEQPGEVVDIIGRNKTNLNKV